MSVSNAEIEKILEHYADLLDIDGANQFKVRAYRNAARVVNASSSNLSDLVLSGEDLTRISGIGKDIASDIKEIVQTQTMSKLLQLQERVPEELIRILELPGLGPKKVRSLYRDLGITTLRELKNSCEAGEISKLSGFGKKSEQQILQAIEKFSRRPDRFLLSTARQLVERLLEYMRQVSGIEEIQVAGSYRRASSTVGDLDILLAGEDSEEIMRHFVENPEVEEVISHGGTRSSVVLIAGIQVDLRVVDKSSFGSALHYFTGSRAHNIAIRHLGLQQGIKVNEYGVFRQKEKLAGRTEQEVFDVLGLDYIEPELRENRGEVEAAREKRLPGLIRLGDIKGDLHMHTSYSDGMHSMEQMAKAAGELGYEYIAVTEHSRSLKVARGLGPETLRQQMQEIDRLNSELEGITVLKGMEVDILQDGSLDLPDDVLQELDLTVCAIHSRFNLSRDKQTERIIRAMDNPNFNILAHPSGRLLLSRDPYNVDMDEIVQAAAEKGVVLELNSHPERLDLDESYCLRARELGVLVSISTDSHNMPGLSLMQYGVQQARRGWLEPGDVLNTRNLRELKNILQR
ncbi:MAG: DNA polymerase/3'-5' exonuclease PolX [Thermodesulfobacteriota bacterium]